MRECTSFPRGCSPPRRNTEASPPELRRVRRGRNVCLCCAVMHDRLRLADPSWKESRPGPCALTHGLALQIVGRGLGHGGPIAPVRSPACARSRKLGRTMSICQPRDVPCWPSHSRQDGYQSQTPRVPQLGTRWEHRRLAGYSGWTKHVSSVSAYGMQKSPLLVQICHIPLPCNGPKASSWATCVHRRWFG